MMFDLLPPLFTDLIEYTKRIVSTPNDTQNPTKSSKTVETE